MGARRVTVSPDTQKGQEIHGHGHGHARHYKDGPGRLWPYVPPWGIWLSILGIAALGRWLWGGNGFYPVMAEAATWGGIWLVYRMTRNLHEVLRVLAVATVFVVGLFIVVTGVLGLNAVLLSLWGGVGFTVCAYWTMRRMLLPAYEKGQRQMSPMAEKLLEALGGAQLGNPKQKVIEGATAEALPGPIHTPITVNRGEQTTDELKHIPRTIETIAGLRPGAARLVDSKTDAGVTELVINPIDLLEGTVPWRGPSHFGESIALPVPVGRYASTNLAQIHMQGDAEEGRNAVQWLVMGMTGAAKSFSIRTLIADLSTRKKVTIWAHDHVKGLQTLRPLIEGGALDWVTMTISDGKNMLAALRLVIQARARWLGIKGYDQWTEDCGLNVLIAWIEEASDLAQLKILLQLVREARSVGVVIIISLQRASHTTIDTDTRAQLAGNICFGVESDQDAKFGLPSHVIDMGAAPERWRADKPGYCYIAAPGIPEAQQAEELRWFLSTKEQIVDACKRGAAVRTALRDEVDQVTVKAAGNVYMKRIPSEAFLNPQHPLFAKAIGMDIGSNIKSTQDGEAVDDEEPTSVGADNAGINADVDTDDDDDDVTDTSEAERVLEAEVDIPECPAPDMGPQNPVEYQKLTPEQCREKVQAYLQALDAEGKSYVTVPDVQRMKPPIPRGREWIRTELKRLAGEKLEELGAPEPSGFRLERDDDMDTGTYRIVPPVREGVTVDRMQMPDHAHVPVSESRAEGSPT